ncbi:pirin family protein [Niabella sp.]|uniref:pirin family protein n=1 Tax=Niabella sp. TaxID=1962976 RepID=UPI00262E05DD|nr:pirin family protein [Niabella sp.]
MNIERAIVKTETPEARQGFLGAGHTARQLVGADFAASDPFIMLMDDVLDKKDFQPAGGAHPHAGFETVSLLLEGEIGDEAYKMHSGDFQLMTAGSGVVHTETIDRPMQLRLLQLWLNLPANTGMPHQGSGPAAEAGAGAG